MKQITFSSETRGFSCVLQKPEGNNIQHFVLCGQGCVCVCVCIKKMAFHCCFPKMLFYLPRREMCLLILQYKYVWISISETANV